MLNYKLIPQKHYPIFLLALCLLLYLPGVSAIPPLDRDEARFAQASKQMVETGDYVNIFLQDKPRHKKPIGIYWLQSFSANIFGENTIASYRLVSVLGATLAVLSFYFLIRYSLSEKSALIGALLLAPCISLVSEAHQAKTDAFLLFTIIIMQCSLLGIFLRKFELNQPSPPWLAYLFWIGLSIGILIKGPVAPMIAGLTIATLCIVKRDLGWLKRLRILTGLPLLLLIVMPWLIAIESQEHTNFIAGGFIADILPRILSGIESHGAPPGYYLLLLPVTFWPGFLLLIPLAKVIYSFRKDNVNLFALAWALPSWIVFELIPTKLPHYTLPLYPALALLIAYNLKHLNASILTKWQGITGFILYVFISVTLAAAIVAIPIYLDSIYLNMRIGIIDTTIALIFISTTSYAGYKYLKGSVINFLTGAIVAAAILYIYLFQFWLPKLDPVWISRNIHEVITADAGNDAEISIAITGFHEPSLVFLHGTHTTKLTNISGVAEHLLKSTHLKTYGIITSSEEKLLLDLLGKQEKNFKRIGAVEGINYSKGKRLTLVIYSKL